MGLRGNLTAGEIVEQLLHALAITPIHNVVFMVRNLLQLLLPFHAAEPWPWVGVCLSLMQRLPNVQGMGEPLNNYSAVRDAVSMMTSSSLFALRRSAVTVSTVGVIPRIQQLAKDLPGVSLALSLHAPTQVRAAQLHAHFSDTAWPHACRQGHCL